MKSHLPKAIQQFIGHHKLHKNKVGQSPADVYSFKKKSEIFYLKITDNVYAHTTYSALREAKILDWLQGKLAVPELILMEADPKREYMITKSIEAKPIAKIKAPNEQYLMGIYQEVLRQLQQIDISNCPFHADRQVRVTESHFFIEHGLLDELDLDEVDLNLWQDFKTQKQLLQYLEQQNFPEDLVFSHGDITDTNIFLDKNEQIYFLDLGRAGIADRFVDIAFVERCLREDCSDQTAQKFIESLENDDPFKRDFFLKLDELN